MSDNIHTRDNPASDFPHEFTRSGVSASERQKAIANMVRNKIPAEHFDDTCKRISLIPDRRKRAEMARAMFGDDLGERLIACNGDWPL